MKRHSLDFVEAHVTRLLQGTRYFLLTHLDPFTIFNSIYHLLRAPDVLIFSLEVIYCSDYGRNLLPLDFLLCFQRFDIICVGLVLGNNLPNEYVSNTETYSSLLIVELMQVDVIVYFLYLLGR